MMRCEIVTDREAFDSLRPLWTGLVQEMESPDPYDTWEWANDCLNAMDGSAIRLFIVVLYESDVCVAIFPLRITTKKIGWLRIRTLRPITQGLATYCGFCLHRAYNERTLLNGFVDALERFGSRWDRLALRNLSSKNNATYLLRRLVGDRFKLFEEEGDLTPYLNYSLHYPEKINKKEHREIQRKERKLRKEHEVNLQLDQPFENALWRRAVELNKLKWADSKFRSPEFTRFYEAVMLRMNREGRLGFSYLEIDGRIEAIGLCFHMGKKVYGKFINYSAEYAKRGIGVMLARSMIEHYAQCGMEEFDFEDGTQPYKFYWTDTVRRNYDIDVLNRSPKKALLALYYIARTLVRLSGATHLRQRLAERARKLGTKDKKRGELHAQSGDTARRPGMEAVGG
ncbi:GNAT family N-acetyltransferase [Cohnella boryungensis]|uniref:GNAT family N-acetyltransferase n=1 Tax=Cohnella boryungensis TaxID=768479 RepID=A0ABV8S4R4_9BACL